LVDQHF
jgi:coatomer subunit beta